MSAIVGSRRGGGGGSSFVVRDESAPPAKVDIVDGHGAVVGSRQLRDLSRLGQTAGYKYIFEDRGEPPQPLYYSRVRLAPLGVAEWPGSEVRTLVQQGDPKNRVDLTIVGDGYTADDKDKFFADAQRLTEGLFGRAA